MAEKVYIDKIHLIKRKLNLINEEINRLQDMNKNKKYIEYFCHSALLIQTTNKNYYILEYGNNSKSKVELRNVSITIQNNIFIDDEYTWNIEQDQHEDISLESKKITIKKIKNIMENIVKDQKYNIFSWNCHMAQEKTRKAVGLKVKNKYNLEKILYSMIL
jgi:hypothetical protein